MRRIFSAPQSPPSCARRAGIAHSARQEGRRYRLRRHAIDSAPFSSLVNAPGPRSALPGCLKLQGLLVSLARSATRRYRCSDTDNVSIKVSVVLGTVYAALNSRSRWLFR
jgi:hypothetical protein